MQNEQHSTDEQKQDYKYASPISNVEVRSFRWWHHAQFLHINHKAAGSRIRELKEKNNLMKKLTLQQMAAHYERKEKHEEDFKAILSFKASTYQRV